ncbi:hypothetical protein PspLS_10932 [Pyricularia sp. CBS 133598]|nr:hypothetical protein PspLS_10932 [Pyricularia sp. CBS 133598]
MHGAETAVTACVKLSTNNTTEPSRNWHTILRWYQWKRTFSVIVLVNDIESPLPWRAWLASIAAAI